LNDWVEKAAIHLDFPRVEIVKEDLPVEALSDLESDAETVSTQEKRRCVREAGLDGVANKWMSRKKTWTSPEVRKTLVHYLGYDYLHTVVSVRVLEGSGETGQCEY
jgi:hypothetical protein